MNNILFIVTEDWYFVSHRLHIAIKAIEKGYKVTILTKVSTHRSLIESFGIKVIHWSINRSGFNFFLEIKTIYATLAVIREVNPDVIHAVALKPIVYSSIVRSLTRTKLSVFAFGGLGFIFSSSSYLARLFRNILIIIFKLLFKNSKIRLILQNQDDIDFFINNKIIKHEKIILIRGAGVDMKEFKPNKLVNELPVVILPARMLWDKGISEFVDCAKKFHENGIAARFCLVGSPDYHNPESISVNQLEEWVESGCVEWWGQQSNMPKVYSKATIVCLPSYREGFPKSLLEAASSGLPIVAFDVPGCREIVSDGVNGLLIPFKNVDVMYLALLKLVENKALSKRMGKKGREIVEMNFSQDIIASQTIEAWNSLN